MFKCVKCAVGMLVLVAGCTATQAGGGGGGGTSIAGDGTVAGCAGQSSGTFTGDLSGSVSLIMATNGAVTGSTLTRESGIVSQVTAQIQEDGSMTGTSDAQGEIATFNGFVNLDECTATGTWNNPTVGASGTWTTRRTSTAGSGQG